MDGVICNDKIDSHKIAVLLKGGMLPMAYVYPSDMRSTRDLLRRRMFFTRKREEFLAHIQNTNMQYNFPSFEKRIDRKSNSGEIENRFPDKSVIRYLRPPICELHLNIFS